MAHERPTDEQERQSDEDAQKRPSISISSSERENDTQPVYPTRKALALIMLALYLAVFLVALDRTIIATAIPRITDDFHSLGDTGWYGSAYLLAQCASQLLFGRIYTFYSPKWVFLVAIGLFELGSAICGAAPTSVAFIVGRAFAGLGNSGIFSGAIVIMVYIVPLAKRSIYQGLIGAIYGVASVMGPLLGGVFTDHVTWRWCFYVNLPIGALTVLIIVLILQLPAQKPSGASLQQQFLQLDPLGNLFLLPSIVCLLLALEWGGSTYAWQNGRIIALLVLAGLLATAFLAVQVRAQEGATVPPRILAQRSMAAGFVFAFCLGAAMIAMVFYLPVWFQAITGVSAVASGIRSLPLMLSLVAASIAAGGAIAALGYYAPFMILSAVLMSVGAGLLTTLQPASGAAAWITYQILFGVGLGLGMQQPNLAAQTVLAPADVAVGASLMFFAQALGGAVFVSVAQTVFANSLVAGLSGVAGLDAIDVVSTGATEIRNLVPADDLGVVLQAYNRALTDAYTVALATACFSAVGAFAVEWRSVKAKGKADGQGGAEAQEKTADGM
ncbi:hypothetical protein MMC27_005950 [Xylographa pallens]|nr:hypothetical protein [Xylographa pallens]